MYSPSCGKRNAHKAILAWNAGTYANTAARPRKDNVGVGISWAAGSHVKSLSQGVHRPFGPRSGHKRNGRLAKAILPHVGNSQGKSGGLGNQAQMRARRLHSVPVLNSHPVIQRPRIPCGGMTGRSAKRCIPHARGVGCEFGLMTHPHHPGHKKSSIGLDRK